MQRARRWAVTVFAGAASFVVCLWSVRAAPLGFLPRAEADRWVVATAFATTVTALVGAAAGRWAAERGQPATVSPDGRAPDTPGPPRPGPQVQQEATASDAARITQVAGHRDPRRADPEERPHRLTQRATASGRAGITQVGGSDGTTGPDHGDR
ncbi:hypothetical protein BJ965_000171 [Streptomyces luteogriseus]|uniref:Uncharacterized protein n=1 Tax=Streptomyces luteogriseus TaxID=68233 RepID=A0A7W7DG97_9ACTN|nr:hypothetical protein [Streptomyces luteogriseus]